MEDLTNVYCSKRAKISKKKWFFEQHFFSVLAFTDDKLHTYFYIKGFGDAEPKSKRKQKIQ